jgi:hypothetical protein
MNAHAAARDAKGRAGTVLRVAPPARARAEWYRCIKWVLGCINRCKKIVTLARDRDRSFLKVENAKSVLEKR